jgi:hypothetical protein
VAGPVEGFISRSPFRFDADRARFSIRQQTPFAAAEFGVWSSRFSERRADCARWRKPPLPDDGPLSKENFHS